MYVQTNVSCADTMIHKHVPHVCISFYPIVLQLLMYTCGEFSNLLTGASCIPPNCRYSEWTHSVILSACTQSVWHSGWLPGRNCGSCNNGQRRCIAECLRNRHAASCRLTWNGQRQLHASNAAATKRQAPLVEFFCTFRHIAVTCIWRTKLWWTGV